MIFSWPRVWPEFGVAGDQQVAQAEDLLVAPRDLRLEVGLGLGRRGTQIDRVGHPERVYGG